MDGTFTIPCFLDQAGCPVGSRFKLGSNGLPVRTPGNVQEERFTCLVPEGATNGRPLIFGHGLFGTADAVLPLAPLAAAGNFVACATDWSGMSSEDVPNALALSEDLSRFPTLSDRTQQGFLNFLFLGRLMIHPQGLASNAEFTGKIDRQRLFYAGASQGGILGGALTAIAPDFERSALIVPAMNFSLLLTRSTQFTPFRDVLYENYSDPTERALLGSMLQVLWDRSEANGYAWHMTGDPLAGTPRHTVLLHEAFGDHQVANVATEVEARVIGARLRTPALDPGRSLDRRPYYGIKPVPSYPWSGNALVVYDIGPVRGSLGTPAAARRQPAAHDRRRPARPHGLRAAGGGSDLRVPEGRRRVREHVRGQALLRGRLDRPLSGSATDDEARGRPEASRPEPLEVAIAREDEDVDVLGRRDDLVLDAPTARLAPGRPPQARLGFGEQLLRGLLRDRP